MNTGTVIYLKITTWRGMSLGAVHYYGKLNSNNYDDKSIELRKKMTSHEAAKLNKLHGYGSLYKAGSSTEGFDTKDEIIELAMREFKNHYPNVRILILGDAVYSEPKKILWCEEEPGIIEIVDNMISECKEINWWEGNNPKRMDQLSDNWEQILNNFK